MDAHETERILGTWRQLAGCDLAFRANGVQVHTGEHQIAPDGYIGVVRLGGAAVVAVRPPMADLVGDCDFASIDPQRLTTIESMTALLGTPDATLGPAVLAFRSSSVLLAEPTFTIVGPVPFEHSSVQQVVAIDHAGAGLSACGYVLFGDNLAHLGVLTASQGRGQGWGRAAATAAIAAANEAGLIPQWRATTLNGPSIALATSLGFEVLGQQLSFKPMPS